MQTLSTVMSTRKGERWVVAEVRERSWCHPSFAHEPGPRSLGRSVAGRAWLCLVSASASSAGSLPIPPAAVRSAAGPDLQGLAPPSGAGPSAAATASDARRPSTHGGRSELQCLHRQGAQTHRIYPGPDLDRADSRRRWWGGRAAVKRLLRRLDLSRTSSDARLPFQLDAERRGAAAGGAEEEEGEAATTRWGEPQAQLPPPAADADPPR